MKKVTIIINLIILSFLIAACSSEVIDENKNSKEKNSTKKENKEETKVEKQEFNYNDIILTLNDFPEDWELGNRVERVKSEMSETALSNEWKSGYYVNYFNLNYDSFQSTNVNIYFSEYPIENIENVFKNNNFDEAVSVDELSNPNIGDSSSAFKIVWTDEEGFEYEEYRIVFIKKNYLVTMVIEGNTIDYEFLLELAKKQSSNLE